MNQIRISIFDFDPWGVYVIRSNLQLFEKLAPFGIMKAQLRALPENPSNITTIIILFIVYLHNISRHQWFEEHLGLGDIFRVHNRTYL